MSEIDPTSIAAEKKKKNSLLRYIIYILIVLIATGVSLAISLWGDNFNAVMSAFSQADVRFLVLMVGVVFFSYLIEGLSLFVFCRLYTRDYKYHQGLATSLIGPFYADVTPGASGGQPMQAYTLKSQGVQVSNAASIAVMNYIIYQSCLIIFDVVAFIFEWNTIMSIHVDINEINWHLPMWPLVVVGFALNLSVIFLLFTMSYSRKFHNFMLHYVIGFLGKIRIIKNPDSLRENLRVQVENFKIELRRLQANVPVLVLQMVFWLAILYLRNSIPYFAGFALHASGDLFQGGFDFVSMTHVSFLTSFHQMVVGLIPLPGSAGVSELFYAYLFLPIFSYDGAMTASTQILWRSATFHIVLLVTGIVAAFYRSRGGKSTFVYANRQTFVTMQMETFAERKATSDTLYETRQLSRRELQKRIAESHKRSKDEEPSVGPVTRYAEPPKKVKKKPAKRKKKSEDEASWETWEI